MTQETWWMEVEHPQISLTANGWIKILEFLMWQMDELNLSRKIFFVKTVL